MREDEKGIWIEVDNNPVLTVVSKVASAVVTTVAPIVNSMVNTLVDGTQPTVVGYGNLTNNSTGIGEDLNLNEDAGGNAVLWPYIAAGGALVALGGALVAYKKYTGKAQGVRVPEEQVEHEEMLDSMPNVETTGIGMLSSIFSWCNSGNQGVRVPEIEIAGAAEESAV